MKAHTIAAVNDTAASPRKDSHESLSSNSSIEQSTSYNSNEVEKQQGELISKHLSSLLDEVVSIPPRNQKKQKCEEILGIMLAENTESTDSRYTQQRNFFESAGIKSSTLKWNESSKLFTYSGTNQTRSDLVALVNYANLLFQFFEGIKFDNENSIFCEVFLDYTFYFVGDFKRLTQLTKKLDELEKCYSYSDVNYYYYHQTTQYLSQLQTILGIKSSKTSLEEIDSLKKCEESLGKYIKSEVEKKAPESGKTTVTQKGQDSELKKYRETALKCVQQKLVEEKKSTFVVNLLAPISIDHVKLKERLVENSQFRQQFLQPELVKPIYTEGDRLFELKKSNFEKEQKAKIESLGKAANDLYKKAFLQRCVVIAQFIEQAKTSDDITFKEDKLIVEEINVLKIEESLKIFSVLGDENNQNLVSQLKTFQDEYILNIKILEKYKNQLTYIQQKYRLQHTQFDLERQRNNNIQSLEDRKQQLEKLTKQLDALDTPAHVGSDDRYKRLEQFKANIKTEIEITIAEVEIYLLYGQIYKLEEEYQANKEDEQKLDEIASKLQAIKLPDTKFTRLNPKKEKLENFRNQVLTDVKSALNAFDTLKLDAYEKELKSIIVVSYGDVKKHAESYRKLTALSLSPPKLFDEKSERYTSLEKSRKTAENDLKFRDKLLIQSLVQKILDHKDFKGLEKRFSTINPDTEMNTFKKNKKQKLVELKQKLEGLSKKDNITCQEVYDLLNNKMYESVMRANTGKTKHWNTFFQHVPSRKMFDAFKGEANLWIFQAATSIGEEIQEKLTFVTPAFNSG